MNTVTNTTYVDRQSHRASSRVWTKVVAWLVALLVLGGIMVAGTYTIPQYPAERAPGDLPSPRAPV